MIANEPRRAVAPRGRSAAPASPLLARARQARELRRKMTSLLPGQLFVDPAWDIMIELVIAAEEGRSPCVKELILVTGESATSALRRIDRLQANGLIHRRLDQNDHRRVLVGLTDQGLRGMTGMLAHMFEPAAEGDAKPAGAPVSFRPLHPRE